MQNVSSLSFDSFDQSGGVRRPSHAEIARVAYQFYLEQGSTHGHDIDDWLRAEHFLLEQLNETTELRPSTPAKVETETVSGLHPFNKREYPFARDERGVPDREDIRRKTSSFRSASRQPRRNRDNDKCFPKVQA